MIMSDLHIAPLNGKKSVAFSPKILSQTSEDEFCDMLEDEWTDDEDSDPNIMDVDEQILFNLDRNFDNEPPRARRVPVLIRMYCITAFSMYSTVG